MHIFAHYSDVVEKVAAALEILAYYGKTASERKRNRIIQDFKDGDMLHALMVANDREIERGFRMYRIWSISKCRGHLVTTRTY